MAADVDARGTPHDAASHGPAEYGQAHTRARLGVEVRRTKPEIPRDGAPATADSSDAAADSRGRVAGYRVVCRKRTSRRRQHSHCARTQRYRARGVVADPRFRLRLRTRDA